MSTIVNSIGRYPSVSGQVTQKLNTALSGASLVATTLTLSPATSSGVVRVKITNGGSSDAAVVTSVTLGDGTATVTIWTQPTALVIANQANSGLDVVIPYNIDINAVTLTVNATLTGTTKTANLDFEINAQP